MTPTPNPIGQDDIACILIQEATPFVEILQRLTGVKAKGIPPGIALVVDQSRSLIGTVTDGDMRRGILAKGSLQGTAQEIMTRDPIAFDHRMSFNEVLIAIPRELRRRNRQAEKFLSKIILVDEHSRPVRVLEYHQLWEQRVATHRHVTIVGLGYVGLTLGLTLADKGYQVTGVDDDKNKITGLNRKDLYIHEIGLSALLNEHLGKNFTTSTEIPTDGDIFIVCVGTPVVNVDGRNIPNLDHLKSACQEIGRRLVSGSLVVLRSTVPIGTTRGTVQPILEQASKLKAGTSFHLAFAPERTVEGNALKELLELPQIIGGINDDSLEATAALFRDLNTNIIRVDSCEAAEIAKLVNNCYRDLIFSFANELVMVARPFNIDIAKVIRASNSGYPRDPIPFPSPGVGGPCLTKDPFILAAALKDTQLDPTLSEHGRAIHTKIILQISERLLDQLEALGKRPENCKVLICGIAFKGFPETGDMRDSPSLDLYHLLQKRIKNLYGYDPVISDNEIHGEGLTPASVPEGFVGMDAVLFMNNHHSFGNIDVFSMVRSMARHPLIFDGWSLFPSEEITQAVPCVYQGLSHSVSSIEENSD